MIVRVRFAKYGVIKFIGHLDVMRYFQKVIRRSTLPVCYSQGYSPHQLMSFAQPLSVGVTSDGEYMEVEFEDEKLIKESDRLSVSVKDHIIKELRDNITEGFEVNGILILPPRKPNVKQESAMSLVAAADYLISVKDGYEIGISDPESFEKAFDDFWRQDSIPVTKTTKKQEKTIDLKDAYYPDAVFPDEGTKHAEIYENGMKYRLRLAAGSQMNVKPDMAAETFMRFIGREYNENAFQFHRMDMYKNTGERFVSLIEE